MLTMMTMNDAHLSSLPTVCECCDFGPWSWLGVVSRSACRDALKVASFCAVCRACLEPAGRPLWSDGGGKEKRGEGKVKYERNRENSGRRRKEGRSIYGGDDRAGERQSECNERRKTSMERNSREQWNREGGGRDC